MGTTPRCQRHPHRPATDLCVRCTDLVCSDCRSVIASQEVVCLDCRRRPRPPLAAHAYPVPEESPTWAVALVLGVFACICVPLGPFGIWFATRALRQPSPGQPRGVAVAALVLNVVGLAWPLAYLAFRKS